MSSATCWLRVNDDKSVQEDHGQEGQQDQKDVRDQSIVLIVC